MCILTGNGPSHIIKLDATKSYIAQRNALLLKILYYTGVRVTELRRLGKITFTFNVKIC